MLKPTPPVRKPDEAFYLVSLSGGALMIWTPGGNVVLSPSASRLLAAKIQQTEAV